MKKSRAEGYSYKLTENDASNIIAFKDRDITELQPTITVLKCGSSKHKYFRVDISLGNICSKQVCFFEILKTDFYPFKQTFDGVCNFMLQHIELLDWESLLAEHDVKCETYEDFLRRISNEIKSK